MFIWYPIIIIGYIFGGIGNKEVANIKQTLLTKYKALYGHKDYVGHKNIIVQHIMTAHYDSITTWIFGGGGGQ